MDQPKPLVAHAYLGGARHDLALQQAEARLPPLAAQLGRTELLERGSGVGITLGQPQLQQRHPLTLRCELTQQALGGGRGALLLLLQETQHAVLALCTRTLRLERVRRGAKLLAPEGRLHLAQLMRLVVDPQLLRARLQLERTSLRAPRVPCRLLLEVRPLHLRQPRHPLRLLSLRTQRCQLPLAQRTLRLTHRRDLHLKLHDLGRSRLKLHLQQLDARLPAVVGHLQPEDALPRTLQRLLLGAQRGLLEISEL